MYSVQELHLCLFLCSSKVIPTMFTFQLCQYTLQLTYQLHNCNRNSHHCNWKFKKKIDQHKCSRKYHQHNCNKTSKPSIATDVGTCRIAIEIVSSIVQQKLPPAELTTEAFTCRNGDNQIVLVTIKKLSEWVKTKFNAK